MSEPVLRIRPAVRALLLTPDADVLLVRFEFPAATVWALPGGGVEPGETDEHALRRELAEELGLTSFELGPHVWSRLHVIPFLNGRWDGQREHIHLVPVPARFEPRPVLTWEQLHHEYVHEVRWWTLDEVRADRTSRFAPSDLADQLDALVRGGPPTTPIDVAV